MRACGHINREDSWVRTRHDTSPASADATRASWGSLAGVRGQTAARNRSMSGAGIAPARRDTSRPPRNTATVGIDMMRYRSPSSVTASVLILTTSHRPAVLRASFSISGAIDRHGPHQGAQKSTTIGRGAVASIASNTAALATSIGTAGGDSGVWQRPHRVSRSSEAYTRRLTWAHCAQPTSTPRVSDANATSTSRLDWPASHSCSRASVDRVTANILSFSAVHGTPP